MGCHGQNRKGCHVGIEENAERGVTNRTEQSAKRRGIMVRI